MDNMPSDPTSVNEQVGRLAEEQYRALAEAMPVQVWTARPDGGLDYVNARVCEYFGRSPEQMIGEGWKDVLHPADVPAVVARWTHSLQTGEPYLVEFRLQRARDGFFRWHIGCASAVRDSAGRIIRWVGTNTDIDDQKRATEVQEAALAIAKLERDRLLQVIMHVPAAMAIYRGPNHEIAVVNPTWERLTGKTNATGKTVRQVFPEFAEQGIIEILGQVYETGKAFHAREKQVMLRRNENSVLEETYWDFVFHPLRKTGPVRDILLHAVEVTENINARRELERLRSVGTA